MIKVYTDGACLNNPGPGGWSCIFIEELEDKEKLEIYSGGESSTTNNRMELMAVLKAMDILVKQQKKCLIEVYSDSAYVVNAVKNDWLKNWKHNGWKTSRAKDVKNKALWIDFLTLKNELKSQGKKVRFIKVKGHAGNKYNEMADKEASSAAKKIKEAEYEE